MLFIINGNGGISMSYHSKNCPNGGNPISTDANRIIFKEDTKSNPLPILAALHDLVSKRKYQDITLDFRRTKKIRAESILPLSAIARRYRTDNITFYIDLPQDKTAKGLLKNTGWLRLISPEIFDSFSPSPTSHAHLPARVFKDHAEQDQVIKECMDLILRTTSTSRADLQALEWSLNEITDNVLNHSKSPYGGVVQVFNSIKNNSIDFYVVDSGITIPRSLREANNESKDITTDQKALEYAIQEGVTSNAETNQGNGLYGTHRCCAVSQGEFFMLSGRATLTYRNDKCTSYENAIPFEGTFIKACIKNNSSDLLGRALFFKGQSHTPAYDYIERYYQTDDTDDMIFNVKKEISFFGSRESGKEARQKILNIMDGYKNTVVFDFDGVNLISSSFADEVFGKIHKEIGPIKFCLLFKFKNISSTIVNLLDRAITQRMKDEE